MSSRFVSPFLISICVLTCLLTEGDGTLLAADQKEHSALTRIKAVMIEQHGTVVGGQLVYVTATAVRFDCQRRGTYIVARAPDWKVYSYSLKTKKWFDMPFSSYVTLFKPFLLVYGIDLSSYQMEKVGSEHIVGQDCSIYSPVPKPKGGQIDGLAARIKGVWLADRFKDLPPQIGDLMEREAGLPPMHKPLIKYDYIQDKNVTHAVSTTWCRQWMVPADFFDLPPGLVKAKRLEDVYPGDTFNQFVP
jgi:hypothetical protein